ncbi:MAG: hypothetical protein ACE5KK_02790 [Candidatus Brocadiales bacterium]
MRLYLLIVLLLTVLALEAQAKEPVSLFKEKCSLCHPLERVLEKTEYSASDWQAVVDNMMEEQDCREKVSREEGERIKEFLSRGEWQEEVSNEQPQPSRVLKDIVMCRISGLHWRLWKGNKL